MVGKAGEEKLLQSYNQFLGFPTVRGTLLEVPIIRINDYIILGSL